MTAQTRRALALYKRTCRGSAQATQFDRAVLTALIQIMGEAELAEYYKHVRVYRDALWRAERIIEWPK